METFKERMKRIRLRAGFKSQQAAANAIQCPRGTVGMWEAPSSNVQTVGEYLLPAARAYKVRPEWINDLNSTDDGYPWEPEKKSQIRPESQRIKIHAYDIEAIDGEEIDPAVHTLIDEVDIMLAAGSGTVIPEYVETKFRMAYRLDWFQRERIDPKHCKLMRVSGDSMESLLFDGDRVLIDLSNTRVRDGKVYAIAIGGEAKIKRLFNQRDGGLRIVSDNPNKDIYPDEIVPPDEMHTVAVIGRVVDKSGRGGL